MKKVRAAAAQISPILDEAGGTIHKVCETIKDAARQGVEFIVFPETLVPYYPYFSFIEPPVSTGRAHLELYEKAVTVPGPDLESVFKTAAENNIVVVLGINERDHGTLYNAQLIIDADGTLLLKRRKITPSFHERMLWGRGDASGLKVTDSSVGRIGALACWEHYNPLARYALMTQHEEIHASQFPGSMVGPIFAEQIEVTIRHHALESGCFVVNATGWLTDEQLSSITNDESKKKALQGGCFSAIIAPDGSLLTEPLKEGEGLVIADLEPRLITKRKRMMDSVGHYARPELLQLSIDNTSYQPVITSEKKGNHTDENVEQTSN